MHHKNSYFLIYCTVLNGGGVGGGGCGGGGGGEGNFDADVRTSISKPTPFIYLAFEKKESFIHLII